MAFASAHNGGRSQVNPNFLNNAGEYAFLNLLKTADPWWSAVSSPSGTPVTPDMIDADGYPTTLTNSEGTNTGGVYVDFFKPPSASRPGNYVVLWDGNGTIYTGLSASLQSGSLTSSGGSGRAVVDFGSAAQCRVGISAIGSPKITNLRVVHVDDEDRLASGEIFGVKFMERLIEGGFGVIRFLNWLGSGSGGNSSNLTNWYSRKPLNYIWYQGFEMRSELYCGSTTLGSGGAYTASAPSICSATGEAWDGVLRDKTTFHILWDRSGFTGITGATSVGAKTELAINQGARDANGFTPGQSITIAGTTGGTWTWLNTTATVDSVGSGTVTVNIDSSAFTGTAAFTNAKLYHANMTLDVDGTGPIQLYGSGAASITPASNWYPVAGAALSLATMTYDEALNAFIMRGGNSAAQIPIGINNGAPLELMLQLCAEIGAHFSFPVPFLCCTPATDLLPNLLWYAKNNMPSWLKPMVEGPNETWNNAGGFLAVLYANAIGNAYGWGTTDYHNWYGKALSLIGQIASHVYDGDRSKYEVMCGVQTATGGSPGSCVTSDPRLSSAKFIANTGGLQTVQPDMVGPWGTITFSASAGVAEAYRWTTAVTTANYFAPGLYKTTTGTVNEVDLAAAHKSGDTSAVVTYMDSLIVPHSIVTFINGSPGNVHWVGHPMEVGDRCYFTTDGAAALGVSSTSVYYVKAITDADNFTISTTSGGTEVTFSGTPTGTSRCYKSAYTGAAQPEPLKWKLMNWKAWAQSFGIQKMNFYEGGYTPDYDSNGSSDLDKLRDAGKSVSSMPSDALGLHGVTRIMYDNCLSLTDETFTSEYPSCFQLGGKTPSNNVWSVLEDVYQAPNPPQWEAIRLLNSRKRRIRLTASA